MYGLADQADHGDFPRLDKVFVVSARFPRSRSVSPSLGQGDWIFGLAHTSTLAP